MLLAIAMSVGVAAEPTVRQEGDTVVVVAVTPAAPAEVRKVLADPNAVKGLFPEVLTEELQAEPGGCTKIRRQTRGLLRPLELFVRRCTTATGYREELVTSEVFDAYTSEWVVAGDAGGGSRVEYRVATSLDAPIPSSTVNAAVRRAAVRAVGSLLSRW